MARWAFEAERLSPNDIIGKYKEAIELAPEYVQIAAAFPFCFDALT